MKNKNINASNLTKMININSGNNSGYDIGRGSSPFESNSRISDKDMISEEERDKLEERKKSYLKKRQSDRENSKKARIASNKNIRERIEKRDAKKKSIKPKSKEFSSIKIETSISRLFENVTEFTKEIQGFSKDYHDRRDILFKLDKINRMSKLYMKTMKDLQRRIK